MSASTENNPVLFVRAENGSYQCVDDQQEWLAKLRYVIDNGPSYAPLLGPLLVRHGATAEQYSHYPAPFLFRTPQERKVAAERRDKTPPQESWVSRKLVVLYRLVGREAKLAA
jgi:hypothetical protein